MCKLTDAQRHVLQLEYDLIFIVLFLCMLGSVIPIYRGKCLIIPAFLVFVCMSDCNFTCWFVYNAASLEEKAMVLSRVEVDLSKVEIGV